MAQQPEHTVDEVLPAGWLTPPFAKMIRFFPPLVSGTLLAVIGVSLMGPGAARPAAGPRDRSCRGHADGPCAPQRRHERELISPRVAVPLRPPELPQLAADHLRRPDHDHGDPGLLTESAVQPPGRYPRCTIGRRSGSGSARRSTSRVTGPISPSPKIRYRMMNLNGLPSVQAK